MRLLKWLNWTLVIPLLAILLLLLTLFYTQPGLRFALWTAEHFVPQLTIGRYQGSLLGGMQLEEIRWQQPGVDTTVKKLVTDIDNRCFWQASICIRQLAVDGLELTLDTTAMPAEPEPDDSPQSSTAMSPIWLPFPLKADNIALDNVRLNIDGTELSWQQFTLAASAWGNKAQLDYPHWQHVRLKLAETAAPPANDQPFSYIPPVLPEIVLPMSLFVNQFRLTDFVLEQEQPQHVSLLMFSLQLQQQQIRLLDFEVQHDMATASGALELTTSGNYPIKGQLQAELTTTELAGQQLTLNLDGSLARLSVEARARNLLQANLDAELQLLTADLPLQLRLTSPGLQWPVGDNPDISLGNTLLSLGGDLNQLQFNASSRYQGPQIPAGEVVLNGNVTPTELQLEQLLLKTLGGQLDMTASADWQKLPYWQASLNMKQLQPGLFWPDYQGQLSGSLQHSGELTAEGGWQVSLSKLDLNGKIRDFPLQLQGALKASDQAGQGDYRFSSDSLQLKHGPNSLLVTGQLAEQWDLDVNLAVPALGDSLADASGEISGKISIYGPRETPRLAAAINASSLSWQDAALSSASLMATIATGDNIRADIQLSAADGRYQQNKLNNVELKLQGTEQEHQLVLQATAPEFNADLTIDGQLQRETQWQGTLTEALLGSVQGNWQLEKPLALNVLFEQQQLTLGAHCWQQQSASLCLTENTTLSAEKGAAKLALKQFELNSLSTFMPDATQLSGSIDANITAGWAANAAPSADIQLTGSAGSLQQQLELPVTLPWQHFSVAARLADNQLSSKLQIQFTEQSALNAEAAISNIQDDNRQLQAAVKLEQFTLQFLQPLLNEYSELEGVLSSDLLISGDPMLPELHGQLALNRFKLKGKLAPADINQADIVLNFNGKAADLAGDIQTPEGKLEISGQAGWQQLDDWHSELRIFGDELRLQIPQARFQVKPDLHITATPALTKLTGTISIPSADITVDSLPQNAITVSDDTILLDDELQPLTETAAAGLKIETDLKVILGNRVRLSAFGLKTSLRGELRVVQQHNQPVITGEVNLIDGTFRSYGQDLLIRQGKMNFNGPADQPFLNVEAIRNPANMEDDVIAGIRVTGPADEPTITIFSEPSKPQANALAYLLLGRDLDSESGSTANAVTTSLIGMGIASSSKLVGEIGEAFGVRDLTLDTAGAGDNSQVTVSGYLSRDLQVKYGVGIFNAIGEFTLRYRLMRSLYLEAVSGLDNAVDLLYKFEFD